MKNCPSCGAETTRSLCKKCYNKQYYQKVKGNPVKHSHRLELARKNNEKHKDKRRAYSKEWSRRNKERRRRLYVEKQLKKYGLSFGDYEKMKEVGCGICKKKFGTPFFDHDHATGDFRGLLCLRCNSALGEFGDNIQGVMRVLHYLQYKTGENSWVQDAFLQVS